MTTKAQLLKLIRQNCIECMGGSPSEVKDCTCENCTMYPFRMGRDPKPSKKRQTQAKSNLKKTEEIVVETTKEPKKKRGRPPKKKEENG